MSLQDLVTTFAHAAADSDPLDRTEDALRALSDTIANVIDDLSFLSGEGSDPEQSFYRSPSVSLLKVKFSPGIPSPPHDHGTWAAILLLEGKERNILYERDGASLRQTREVVLGPGDVLPMRAGAIHVVECASRAPAVGLHVYGGDLPILPRSVWHPETFEEYDHTDAQYAALKALALR